MEIKMSLFECLCMESNLYEAWKAVRNKKSAGGVDGITLSYFEDNIQKFIGELVCELKSETWSPEPYFRIEIPKKKNEVRRLGLLSVKDKIVQQAIKTLI